MFLVFPLNEMDATEPQSDGGVLLILGKKQGVQCSWNSFGNGKAGSDRFDKI
jgi:hypothetical protein